jgi:transcriptional regulator with XRE-family HTH domain
MVADKKVMLNTFLLMRRKGMSTQELATATDTAYNTILAYRRNNAGRFSRRVLEDMAQVLGVEPWELFYTGEYSRPLLKIAQALGVVDQSQEPPITLEDYERLFEAVARKVGAEITPADFTPLPVMSENESD